MATAEDVRARLHAFGLERGRLTAAVASAAGVSGTDLAALEHIERAGSLTQKELGDRLLLTPGSVTTLVDRLERAGWAERRRHPRDRRSTLLTLTAKAAATARGLGVGDYEAAVSRAAARLTESERSAVSGFLAEVTAAAEARTERVRATPRRRRG
jgi:DNA-binding MarR family transcriptional regulator